MDELSQRHLNHKCISFKEVAGSGKSLITFDLVTVADATRYAAEDADVTLRLWHALKPRLSAEQATRVYERVDRPLIPVLARMEMRGIKVDREELARMSAEFSDGIAALEIEIHGLAGEPFSVGSPKQLGEIFFDKLGLPVIKKTATGARSTDEEVLEKLAEDYPLPARILEHRSLSKLKGTYTDKLAQMALPRTGRVHTHYAQAVAVTGRLSSNDPNLQNIPIRTAEGRKVREAFVAPAGHVIASADYSQIELRIMAHISDDPALLKAFHDGLDVHKATAAEVFGLTPDTVSSEQRRYAKVINFGLIYGMSAFGLAKALGIEKMSERCVQGRAVMIDLHAHVGNTGAVVGYDMLMDIMAKDKVVVEEGDMVCLHTGFGEVLLGMNKQPVGAVLDKSGSSLDGRDERLKQWITDSGLIALIADNYAVETYPALPHAGACASLPLHEHCLFKLGVHLGELWHLTPLANWLRAHGRSRFLLTAPPLRLPGAIGSPAAPIATV